MRECSGSAEVLGIFAVFVIITSIAAVYMFEAEYRNHLNATQRRLALDATKATMESLKTELNTALRTSIEAAMYEVGKSGGTKNEVDARTRRYFNDRIKAGWSYYNFSINVPLSDENSLRLVWQPDGGLEATGYLSATVEHISGVKGFGAEILASAVPRYGRMYFLANKVYGQAIHADNLEALENEYNENYACERFHFSIDSIGGQVIVTVRDEHAGRALAPE